MIERLGARVFWALTVAWAVLLFWESSQARPFPFVPDEVLSHDKLLHLAAYVVLGALLAGALGRSRLGPLRGAILAALLASAYGASDEDHQSFVPGRDADPWDWAADTFGGLAGATGLTAALRRRKVRASIRA